MNFLQKVKNLILSKIFLRSLGVIIVVYIVVVGFTMFYLDSYTNHGEKITVPNLKGKNIKTIQPLMAELNLDFDVLDSIYDPELAAGTIIDQDPRPTELSEVFVKEGRTIRLRVSKRNRVVEMPDLVDKSQRFAESVLENRGLKVKVSYRNSTEANGAVLQQLYHGKEVKEGMKLAIGSIIQLIVGRNEGGMPVDVPNLYGLTIQEAKIRLGEMYSISLFPVCADCRTSADSIQARVNSQTPAFGHGSRMSPGGTIAVNATVSFIDTTTVRPE
jgi:beta-lactam-binding protein with PASTA domain